MKQYIDKAALVTEIERRRDLHYKYYMKNGVGSIAECKYDEDREILSFLDTIDTKEVQEEPVSKDLEAEFVLYLKRKFNIPQEGHKLKTNGWRPSPYDILDIARHFAQWQKEQLIEKMCVFLESTDFFKYYNKEFVEEFKKAMEE